MANAEVYVAALFLGLAVGLFEYGYFSPQRQNGIFIAALILGAFSVLLLGWTLFASSIVYFLAALLIIAGIWLIAARGNRRKSW
ncbi:hypothetical protein HMSSN139_38060 [Paenibacillus sp. HMSSN-139]|nr:hypothetical protein HMSSN139_38060 [Paenibacillus sp. HMSSN-139]